MATCGTVCSRHHAVFSRASEARGCGGQEIEPLNMHRTHHRLLYFCARRPGHTVGDAVRALRLTPQAAQTPMRDLIRIGWIEQCRSKTDKRQRQLYLATLGWEMHAKLASKQFDLLDAVRKKVGERAFSGFIMTLRALTRDSDLELFDG